MTQTYGQLSSEKIAVENEECRKIVREVLNVGLTQRQQMFLIYLLSLELENISHVKDLTDVIKEIAAMNPIEMIEYYKVDKTDLSFFLAYGGKDQFNLDAQAESFLDRAREKNLDITVRYDPKGKHDTPTAIRILPELLEWLGGQMAEKAEGK